MSADGGTWDLLSDANVCLKAATAGSGDLTPPTTTVTGADSNWHRSSVTLRVRMAAQVSPATAWSRRDAT